MLWFQRISRAANSSSRSVCSGAMSKPHSFASDRTAARASSCSLPGIAALTIITHVRGETAGDERGTDPAAVPELRFYQQFAMRILYKWKTKPHVTHILRSVACDGVST